MTIGDREQGGPMCFAEVAGHRIEYCLLAAHRTQRPTLVFLHEGLGSVAMWRDFPERVAAASGCRALLYSRYGYGQSDVLAAPFTPRYLHDEALLALPQLLERLQIERPVLIGHSDGASIALIHAGDGRWNCAGLVLMAPHVFVEAQALQGIARAGVAFQTTDWPGRLARYHRDAQRSFHGWKDIWLSPAFRDWNICDSLPRIGCPILAIQGEGDEYASMAQIDTIAAMAGEVELLKLADCAHSPHRDQPQATLNAILRFVAAL